MSQVTFTTDDFKGAPALTLKRGSCMIYEGEVGDRVGYFIVSGSVEVQTECYDGTQTLLYVLKAGSLFGELRLMGVDERTASIYTAEETVLLKINPQIWQDRMQDVDFLQRVHAMHLQRYLKTTDAVRRLGQSSVTHRLATYLMTLPEWHNRSSKSMDVVLPSHSQLARMLNCTRERITVVMQQFYKSGAVVKQNHQICTISQECLTKMLK